MWAYSDIFIRVYNLCVVCVCVCACQCVRACMHACVGALRPPCSPAGGQWVMTQLYINLTGQTAFFLFALGRKKRVWRHCVSQLVLQFQAFLETAISGQAC